MSLPDAIAWVLEKEAGELTDNPSDPGGLTRWGIALNRHPDLTAEDIRNMTAERAGQIFAHDYWPARSADLPGYLATPLLASCVLQGPVSGVEILQAALGAHIDGNIGPQTISAAQGAKPLQLLARHVAEQVRRLRAAKAWPTDGIGWVERATEAALVAAGNT